MTPEQLEKRRQTARDYMRRQRSDPVIRIVLARRAQASRSKRYHSDPEWRAAYIAKTRARIQDHTERINSIKLESGCVDCGYQEYACALDFDHLPGFVKLFTIGNNAHRSWAALEAEMDKCDVVCANCHRVRTHVSRDLTERSNACSDPTK